MESPTIAGVLAQRTLADGRTLCLLPLVFGARLTLGRGTLGYDDGW